MVLTFLRVQIVSKRKQDKMFSIARVTRKNSYAEQIDNRSFNDSLLASLSLTSFITLKEISQLNHSAQSTNVVWLIFRPFLVRV